MYSGKNLYKQAKARGDLVPNNFASRFTSVFNATFGLWNWLKLWPLCRTSAFNMPYHTCTTAAHMCVSVFGSVICEFIFIAEQMLHRKTAQPCAVCCSCRRRNTRKVANKAKYPIDSCCACLCTCLYKCINVVNTHTHSCCKWLHLHNYGKRQLRLQAQFTQIGWASVCSPNL